MYQMKMEILNVLKEGFGINRDVFEPLLNKLDSFELAYVRLKLWDVWDQRREANVKKHNDSLRLEEKDFS